MKIQVVGDLHIYKKNLHLELNPEADVLVIPGDLVSIHNTKKVKALFNSIRTRTEIPVLYVLGNHDYYDRTVEGTSSKYKKISDRFDNIFLLDRGTKKIDNVVFLGCTLWSHLTTWGDMISAVHGINDFDQIKINNNRINPDDYNALNQRDKDWLYQAIVHEDILDSKGHKTENKVVVITHHAPSWQCVHRDFRMSRLNPCFVNNLDGFLEMHKPDLWIHGHTHQFHDLTLYKTRVVNNPIGYDFEDSRYKPGYIVEI